MQTTKHIVDKLNDALRGELSAVETYEQALNKIKEPEVRSVLEDCQSCHSERAQLIRQEVRSLGETPSQDSGAWGAFAKLVEGGATPFGTKAALGSLEEGEDHGLEQYEALVKDKDIQVQTMAQKLLDMQKHTQKKITDLKEHCACA